MPFTLLPEENTVLMGAAKCWANAHQGRRGRPDPEMRVLVETNAPMRRLTPWISALFSGTGCLDAPKSVGTHAVFNASECAEVLEDLNIEAVSYGTARCRQPNAKARWTSGRKTPYSATECRSTELRSLTSVVSGVCSATYPLEDAEGDERAAGHLTPALPWLRRVVIQSREPCNLSLAGRRTKAQVCLHIFSPGKRLELDYVAESIVFRRGGSEETIEMLVTNHSTEGIDRIHVVYPRALPRFPKDERGRNGRTFQDWTATWLDPNASPNLFYQSTGTMRVDNPSDDGYELKVSIEDPQNPSVQYPYAGWIRGNLKLTRYQLDDEPLNDQEWAILSRLGWAVITIHFESVIKPSEARWLRVFARGGPRAQNTHPFLEYWYRKLCGLLIDTFKIEGPVDLKERIILYLRAAAPIHLEGLDRKTQLVLPIVVEKVLRMGLQAPSTDTVVQDWRLFIFWRGYRRVNDPVPSGDIVAITGSQVTLMDFTRIKCYQFRAGVRSKQLTSQGRFLVSVSAEDIPVLVPALAWISVVISIFSAILAIMALIGHR
jgi:hypothetical protein